MKVTFNLEKRFVYGILGMVILFAGIVAVYAYETNMNAGSPSVMGHSSGEVDVNISGTIKTLQQAINDGNLGGGSSSGGGDTRCDTPSTCSQVCIGTNCRTGWPSSSDSDWTISGSNMYSAVSGNVGVGVTSPAQKLHVNGNVRASGFCIGTSCITSWPTSTSLTVSGENYVRSPSAQGLNTVSLGTHTACFLVYNRLHAISGSANDGYCNIRAAAGNNWFLDAYYIGASGGYQGCTARCLN